MEDRRLAAIMFTDIIGYTKLMASDEKKAFEVLRRNRNIQKPTIKKYRGKWLKEMGDGILASFDSASDAVRCAGEIQNIAGSEGVNLRIGIHVGEVVFEGRDVFGDGVNVASRLEELAPAGGIHVSGSVYRDIRNKSGIRANYLGEKSLKNVEDPVKVYQVLLEGKFPSAKEEEIEKEKKSIKKKYLYTIGIFLIVLAIFLIGYKFPRQIRNDKDKLIAVLPFLNDSPDPDNVYLANGIMDELISNLQKVASLRVVPRTSIEKFRDSNKGIREIGNELGVSYLVSGSVRRAGDNLRINVQLIDVDQDNSIWSDTYDGKYTQEIFEFQSNLAKDITAGVHAFITPHEKTHLENTQLTSIEAYDLSLRGWQMLREWGFTHDSTYRKVAYQLFNEALKYDSTYMKALSGIGTYFLRSGNYDSALYFIDKQITLYPGEVSGFGGKGGLWIQLGQPDSALKYLTIAEKITPNDFWVNIQMGQAYWGKNEYNKALHYFQKAYELTNDLPPNIGYIVGRMFLEIGEYSKAEKYFKESFNIKPLCFLISLLNMTYLAQGKFDHAIYFLDSICIISPCAPDCNRERFHIYFSRKEYMDAELYYNEEFDEILTSRSVEDVPFMDQVSIAWIYFETGRTEEANEILKNTIQEDQELLRKDPTWPNLRYLRLAAAYAIKGENETALKYLKELEKIEFNYGWHDFIEYYPPFDNLKSDPEFKAIVRKAQEKKAFYRTQVREMEERGELNL